MSGARERPARSRSAPVSGPPALAFAGAGKRYGEAWAVERLDLAVERGRVLALVGPNGSGKTTTLSMAAGLVRADRGTVLVAGRAQPSTAARAAVALVPDEPSGLDELTLEEFLRLYAALHGSPAGFPARARALVAAFGLDERTRSRLGSLSHGLRRRASAAAAFALAPPVVLVDEATAALDPEAVIVLREAVRALAEAGSAVVLATQDLHFGETASDDVAFLSAGRLLAHGAVADVLADAGATTLEDAFLALVDGPALEDLRAALRPR